MSTTLKRLVMGEACAATSPTKADTVQPPPTQEHTKRAPTLSRAAYVLVDYLCSWWFSSVSYLLRELDQSDLRHKQGGGVARLDGRAEHEAPHDVAVAAHHLHRHVLSRLRSLHPALLLLFLLLLLVVVMMVFFKYYAVAVSGGSVLIARWRMCPQT